MKKPPGPVMVDVHMTYAVATTTWNSIDVVSVFLDHYRRLGFDRAFVMDFDSTDGTREALEADGFAGFVTLVPFPGLAALDSSNLLLSAARAIQPKIECCLFCDPDELLVTPSMRIEEAVLTTAGAAAESMTIPRFNVTAPRSIAQSHDSRLSPLDALTLRIDRRCRRSADGDAKKDVLDPAWIFTAIPGKILVRLDAAIAIDAGDHGTRTRHDRSGPAPTGVYLLHYPFRGYAAFREKVDLARVDFEVNSQLSASHGWQVRRWIHLMDAGRIREEYLEQFVADEEVENLLSNGTLHLDLNVQTFHLR